ncbi:PaaI family thioesterase [Zestomonas thermotolerans]|uniref:PaaI family thioesterase n=1 Tax=Zestomonas thermotolerans TaxID=157784 RepID=UPI001E2E677D|nr:PaaI family thioesterase [Pseudomonas thermotolerans]
MQAHEHLNDWQSAHGAVIMALLDMAMALASDEQQRGCVTVEMKNNFLRPAGNVGDVKAFGMARHASRSLAFCEAELRNSQDEVVTTASGTFKYLDEPCRAPMPETLQRHRHIAVRTPIFRTPLAERLSHERRQTMRDACAYFPG